MVENAPKAAALLESTMKVLLAFTCFRVLNMKNLLHEFVGYLTDTVRGITLFGNKYSRLFQLNSGRRERFDVKGVDIIGTGARAGWLLTTFAAVVTWRGGARPGGGGLWRRGSIASELLGLARYAFVFGGRSAGSRVVRGPR